MTYPDFFRSFEILIDGRMKLNLVEIHWTTIKILFAPITKPNSDKNFFIRCIFQNQNATCCSYIALKITTFCFVSSILAFRDVYQVRKKFFLSLSIVY